MQYLGLNGAWLRNDELPLTKMWSQSIMEMSPFPLNKLLVKLNTNKQANLKQAWIYWCWRSLLGISWTVKWSKQSIIKEINPEHSLEGLMLKLKPQHFGHLMQRIGSLEKTLSWERLKAGEVGTTANELVGWHVLLVFSCFFYDPVDVSNLISGSSAFSKSCLNIWESR